MSDGHLMRQVRRCNRNLLLDNGLILLGLCLAAAICWRYLLNFIVGPTPMDVSELRPDPRVKDRSLYFVSIAGENAADSGFREVTKRIDRTTRLPVDETVAAKYSVIAVGNHMLLAKLDPHADITPDVTGALRALSQDVHSKIHQGRRGRGSIR